MTTSQWTIELLGPLCVRRDEEVITHFRTYKTGAMLAYLAAYPGRSARREELIDIFWPDNELESGRNCLRIALSAIRKIFHPDAEEVLGTPAVLLADREYVRLNPLTFTTDKAQFELCLLKAMRTEDIQERVDWLQQGLGIYQSDLLPGYDELWISGERQRLIDARLLAARRLVPLLVKMHNIPSALDYAQRAVESDPLREESQRMLIQLYAGMGQNTDAMRQYQSLERDMHNQLGMRPSAATRALVAQLNVDSIPSESGSSVTTMMTGGMSSSGSQSPRSLTLRTPRVGKLPIPYSPFFGHENSIAQIIEMLETPHTRLVTITGLGGSGKTRLALVVGEQMRESLESAVWFVSLAEVDNHNQIHNAIARSMELPCQSHMKVTDQVAQALGDMRALLILDNFEHLAVKGNKAIQELLEVVPNLSCLVTSRQRLNIAGEYEYAVAPLPTPLSIGTPERLMEFPSVQLFVNRAQAVRPNFHINRENAAPIANLCHYLEGVPLAIELAAAYAQVLSPLQIRERLSHRFSLLVNQNKDVPERHASLYAALDWSYRLLEPSQQRFFVRLSVLHGGWTLEAAEAICTDPTSIKAPEAISAAKQPHNNKWKVTRKTTTVSLLSPVYMRASSTVQALMELRERSIVQALDHSGAMRYQMLETLREFAEEHLDTDEMPDAHTRHGLYFLGLAEQAEPHLIGADTAEWLNRLQDDYANFRTALKYFLKSPSGSKLFKEHEGLRLASSLIRFWYVRGYYEEGQEWLELALKSDIQAPAPLRLNALRGLGNIAFEGGKGQISRAAYQELLELSKKENDQSSLAAALCGLGNIAKMEGNLETARSLREESLRLCHEIGDERGIAVNAANLANVLMAQGEGDRARQLYQESLDLFRSQEDTQNIVLALNNLAHAYLELKEDKAAYGCLMESLTLLHRLENKFGFIHAIINLTNLFGRYHNALQAVRLLGSASAQIDQMMLPKTHYLSDNLNVERMKLRTALDTREFEDNWNYGLSIPFEQAIQIAQEPLSELL